MKLNEQKKKSIIKKLQETRQGKAILKLGIWLLFFFVLGVMLLFRAKPDLESENSTTTPSNEENLSFKEMWNNLEKNNYTYEYKIIEKNTLEETKYVGKKVEEINTGTRESKIGLITYNCIEESCYQVDSEETKVIEDLYLEEDIPYLNLANLKKQFNILTMSEENNTILFKNENETIKIIFDTEKISSILIETNEKEYQLTYKE